MQDDARQAFSEVSTASTEGVASYVSTWFTGSDAAGRAGSGCWRDEVSGYGEEVNGWNDGPRAGYGDSNGSTDGMNGCTKAL